MLTNHTRLIYGALLLASAFLTACGGGGGGGTTAAATYSIGGTVSGLTGTGLVLRNGTENLPISTNGSFTFTTRVAGGAPYNVTVQTQPTGQTCTASNNNNTVGSANITTVSVICSANTYTIGGSISGLTGTGLVLQNNGANDLSVSAGAVDFTFTAPVASGGGYAVTVLTQPAGQRCTVTGGGTGSGSGTNVQANITSVVVACVPVYTISATITGLGTSIGLKLQNSGNNALAITADGTFPFSSGLAQGENYDVKVLIQPAAPALTCTVTGGLGQMGTIPVIVNIACQPPVPSYAYVANYNSNDISAYSIDSVTGVLAQVNCAPPTVCTGSNFTAGTGPHSVTVVPSGKFAYVANLSSSDISAYAINATTGALTQIDCGGGAGCNGNNFLAGTNPISVIVDSSGRFVYVTNVNSGDISAYAINATTGALTQINCAGGAGCNGNNFLAGNNPSAVTVDHSGQFVYVANANDNSVSAYTINAATGALTRVLCGGGTACVTGNDFLAGAGPQSIEVDPTSRFAYVSNANDNSVSAYSINAASGSLTPIDADPATAGVIENFAAGTTPTSITIDPSGKYVYVANFGSVSIPGSISAYSITAATGALTAIPTSPFSAGTGPTSVTTDLSGKFVYVANYDSANVSAYSITNGSGALSAIATSPYPAGNRPRSVVTTIVY